MMQQPELGNQIVNYRKIKGLTQEALVDKCNINVRTLQRIEAGEVTPRIQTIKLIFEALEINYEESITVGNSKLISEIKNPIMSLFNFKTNATKKIIILSVVSISLLSTFYITKSYRTQKLKAKHINLTNLNHKFIEYYNTGQLDSLSTLFTEDTWFMDVERQAFKNKKDIIKHYKTIYDLKIRIKEAETNFRVISDSIAVDRGNWFIGNKENSIAYHLFYMRQWRYYNGKWQIENLITNTDYIH